MISKVKCHGFIFKINPNATLRYNEDNCLKVYYTFIISDFEKEKQVC